MNDLAVDILAPIPFMAVNDISVRPARQQIMIAHMLLTMALQTHDNQNHVRRTQAYVLKLETSSVIWPGEYRIRVTS